MLIRKENEIKQNEIKWTHQSCLISSLWHRDVIFRSIVRMELTRLVSQYRTIPIPYRNEHYRNFGRLCASSTCTLPLFLSLFISLSLTPSFPIFSYLSRCDWKSVKFWTPVFISPRNVLLAMKNWPRRESKTKVWKIIFEK